MSKDVMEVKAQMPDFLKAQQATAPEEYTTGLDSGMPLPVLSIRGKEFRLRKDGQEVPTRLRDLDIVFIGARTGISKRLYEEAYESGETELPDCSSPDGVTPDIDTPVASTCTKCPNNVWGSRITPGGRRGKKCSDYKRIIVAAFFDGKLSGEPLVLDIPAASLKRPKAFKGNELMYKEYMQALVKHDMPINGVVSTLSFTDAEYPQLCFAFCRYVNQQEYDQAEIIRAMPEVEQVKGPVYESPGPITESPAPKDAVPAKAEAPAPATETNYPDTLAELNNKKMPELKKLAAFLEVNTNQKKADLRQAIAEELELSENEPRTTPPPAEEAPQESTPTNEAAPAEADDDETMAQLKAMLSS